MEKDIICVCEVKEDIDDLIALDFLYRSGRLKGVVLDPPPKTREDYEKVKTIKEKGIQIYKAIPTCKSIFVGGALTSVARYLLTNKLDNLIMNGGYVGNNIVQEEKQLSKFKGKEYVRTFNFSLDIDSTRYVLSSPNINNIFLIGKNVCHDKRNTLSGIWKEELWISEYPINEEKRLHDVLAYSEGLNLIDGKESERLIYKKVRVKEKKMDNGIIKFGSDLDETTNITAAIMWK